MNSKNQTRKHLFFRQSPNVGFFLWIATLLVCFPSHTSMAADVTVRTAHPHYPGEGAFQTVDDCVAFATNGKTDAQDRAIAMYNWFLTHQWHLMSPMEWCVPGRIPDTAARGDYETVVFDANRARFSYGYGLCGTVHAWNEPYWKALGFPARRREFPGHVNSEIFYEGGWHAFDTDMAGLLFRPDGVVAGYADIQKDPNLADSVQPPIPHYPFAWPSDFKTMNDGWKKVAARDHWYSLYNGGYAAHPGIVELRSNESFTRWYDRDHFGGESKRRFWQNQKGGPQRSWTFFDNGLPQHDKATSNSRSNAAYCNGIFDYAPNLANETCQQGMQHFTENITHHQRSPQLRSSNADPASVTFRHFAPYVICGDPIDDANPMSGSATDGLIVQGRIVGRVLCELSANEGQTWKVIPIPKDDSFQVDLTDLVKGRYGWQIRFQWEGAAGLDQIRFLTTTQVCQAMYPRLTANGCEVTIKQKQQAVVAVLPDFALPEEQLQAVEVKEFRSGNLNYQPRSPNQRFAFLATDNQPAHVAFKVKAPGVLRKINAAFRYQLPIPPPPGCEYKIQVSTDNANTWSTFATAEIPMDNEFSSGWLAADFDIREAAVTAALIRFVMHAPGRKAAMIDAQLYGIYEVPEVRTLSVEFGWRENGERTRYARDFTSGRSETVLQIPTGEKITDEFVKLSAME